jgi:hypothetical protein
VLLDGMNRNFSYAPPIRFLALYTAIWKWISMIV